MSVEQEVAANLLLRIRAPHFYTDKPFVFTSGTHSPVYVDCRKLISYPAERRIAMALAADAITKVYGADTRNLILAGGETAGIPFGAWLSDELNVPLVYVRKSPKGFGRLAQIEGDLPSGVPVILIEDLMFDAKSKINFCNALRQAGAQVEHCLVVFDYGIPASAKTLHEAGLTIHALTTWKSLLAAAEKQQYFNAEQCSTVREFLADPKKWSDAHPVA